MKTNAIIRIAIWSLVIIVLSSILLGAISYSRLRYDTKTYSVRQDIQSADGISTVALKDQPILSMPNTETGNMVGALEKGDTVTIRETAIIDDISWAYLSAPEKGWVPLDTLQLNHSGSTESILGIHGEISAANIRKIAIEWVAGDILILPKDDINTIRFAEEATSDSRYQMVWKESGEKLTIRFCEESFKVTGFSLGTDIVKKDLTIEVPSEWVCQELELDVASANLDIQGLTIREVDFDGASGTCDFTDCTIGDLDMDTASGDVTFQGRLDMLDFDAASASFTGRFDNTPSRIDVDGMSGDVELILPADGGYTVSMDGMSSSFTAESHLTETRNGLNIYGNGSCRIDMDGMSCNLLIRLHHASSGSVPPHHIHTESCQTDPDTCPDHQEEHHSEP